MGLAPYGRPGAFDFEIFDCSHGRVRVRYDWMERFGRPVGYPALLQSDFQLSADLAHHVQREVERAILYVIKARHEMRGHANLAYSGGVALNAVANSRICRETPFQALFVQPAAGDNGLALGCAYYGWRVVLGKERIPPSESTCFGRSYSRSEIERSLERFHGSVRYERSPDYIRRAAAFLANRRVVAWFQEGCEFGPRALGHRSILADPRIAAMRDHINEHIKFREDFRPFAPAVLEEDVSEFFDSDLSSPYMLMVADVRPAWRSQIPSVVHRNHTARLQTVTNESDAVFHSLITEFKVLTGLGVVLNTSFNRRGMPIVETPVDALEFFASSAIDVLVIGDYIVEKLVDVPMLDVLPVPTRRSPSPAHAAPEFSG